MCCPGSISDDRKRNSEVGKKRKRDDRSQVTTAVFFFFFFFFILSESMAFVSGTLLSSRPASLSGRVTHPAEGLGEDRRFREPCVWPRSSHRAGERNRQDIRTRAPSWESVDQTSFQLQTPQESS